MREPTAEIREPQGFTIRASRMAAVYVRDHWRGYLAAAGAGVFLALIGAFGMDETSLAQRLLYWVPTMLAGAVIGTCVGVATARRPKIGENHLLLWAVITVLVALPTTVLVWAMSGAVFGDRAPSDMPFYLGPVLLISAPMTAIMMLLNRPGPATHAAPAGAAPAPVRFAERLPAKILGGVIYAVEAEDHYLRVRTSKGDDLILLRLADAMAELDGVEGAQVHRSWWVARDGVAEVKRDGGRVTLVLKDGAEAPVSRPNVKALREAGWW